MAMFEQWTDIKDNYDELGAVTSKTFTVPAGKHWILYGGYAERDASATLNIGLYDENDKLVCALIAQISAGTSNISWGCTQASNSAYQLPFPIPMDVGWYVKYTWGAQQTTPEVTCLVCEG